MPESGVGSAFDHWIIPRANHHLNLTVTGQCEAPLLLEYTLMETSPAALSHLTIHGKPGSSLTVVEVIRGGETGGVFGSLIQVMAEQDARIRLIQLQMPAGDVKIYAGMAARTGENARVASYRACLGGALCLCGGQALLEGRKSEFDVQNVYLGDGHRVIDLSDVAIHTGEETHSEIHAAGVLDGESRKILRGTIDFRRGAVHAVGHESEDVLLLSPHVRNRTAPLILCGEEQVEGQHAASAGRLDERMLYYMASRGIDGQTARGLMIRARFSPVLEALPPDLRCEAEAYLEGRLAL